MKSARLLKRQLEKKYKGLLIISKRNIFPKEIAAFLFCSILAILISFTIFCGAAFAERAENFALLDQNGDFHELFYYSDKKAVVVISQGNGCPIVRQSIPYLKELKDIYEPRGVIFMMINPNPQDDRLSIIEEAKEFNIPVPILEDKSQVISRALNIARTAESIVIDPKNWEIVYHGPIHDLLGYETKKEKIENSYLKDAIEAVIQNKQISSVKIETKGCLINFDSFKYKYTQDVAPILVQKCMVCHTPGGVAPWSMDNYSKIVGWGPMIREAIRTKRMPPWHADGDYGDFKNDLSLTPQEVSALVRWIEQGFVKGNGKDPLLTAKRPSSTGWALGKPDRVISIKEEQEVPLVGKDEYRFIEGEEIIDENLWVKALEVKPTNPRVVHHCNVVIEKSVSPSSESTDRDNDLYTESGMTLQSGQMIAGYSPGMGPMIYPQDTGIFIPKGSKLIFRIHYIVTGRVEKDKTQVGLYLHEKPPSRVLSVATINNRSIKIPPGEKDYRVKGEFIFKDAVQLMAVQPHMHYRGRSMRFTVEYPNGTSDVALSVPNYKFNWQRYYVFKKPKKLPAGARIIAEGRYDNSLENKDNPDASKEINYGPGSGEEMFTGILFFIKEDKEK